MKASLRTFASTLFALALVALCAAGTSATGQARDMRVVSARAGGVNYVFGDVQYRRAGKDRWQALSTKDDLRSGDSVRTGATGLVEVLLNPGSYLRLGTASEFELTDGSLEGLRLRIVRGRAVVEATGYDNHGLLIKVDTPQTQVSIIRSGIYRIDAPAGGPTTVTVQKGRARVGADEATATLLKGGAVARVAGAGVEVAKLDKRNRDELDQWSRERGEELAEANRRLTRRQANTLVAAMGYVSPQYAYGYTGVWYYDVRRGCYTFMPFAAGWRSPYGGWYDNMMWGWGHPMPCASYGGCRGVGVGSGFGNTTVSGSNPGNTGSGVTPGIRPGFSPGLSPGAAPIRDIQRPSDGNGLWQKMSPASDPVRPRGDH
jgi:hypothetical protein